MKWLVLNFNKAKSHLRGNTPFFDKDVIFNSVCTYQLVTLLCISAVKDALHIYLVDYIIHLTLGCRIELFGPSKVNFFYLRFSDSMKKKH